MQNHLKNKVYDVISGKSQVRFGTIIQAIASYLSHGSSTGSKIENTKQFKKQETERLEYFISENNFWINTIDLTQYVSEGAEQKVYLKDSDHVLKLNNAIYYSCWKVFLQLIAAQFFL
jgi:hypothetical protein